MKKIIPVFLFLSIIVMASVPLGVQARQEIAPHIFDTTIPVAEGLRDKIDAWLPEHNPSSGTYYAITYVLSEGFDSYIVCLASLNIASPDEKWTMTQEPSKVIWLGSVRVNPDGSVDLLTETQSADQTHVPHLATIGLPAAGGGSDIRWPFETGKTVMYGPNGVHAAGYSTYGSGMMAVDLVGGSDFGSGGARNFVFASAAGDIDYVCTDGTSDMIRVNDGAGNKFIYAHLIDNYSLEMGHSFVKGASIGNLVSGTFDDDCGDADQQDNHWHVHWGFVPANNAFVVEDCTIKTNTSSITCSNSSGVSVINPGQFLTSSGIAGSDDRQHGTAVSTPTFWDYFLVGFINIVDRGIIKLLPEHTSPTLLPRTILNTVKFVLKLTYALLVENFNLGPAMAALFAALLFRTLIGAVWLTFVILRTIKAIPGG